LERSGVYKCTDEPGLRSGTVDANDDERLMLAIIGEFGIDVEYLLITFENISGNGPFVFRKEI
jgi:hypothetical protein